LSVEKSTQKAKRSLLSSFCEEFIGVRGLAGG
jgi:hypothetical protein